MRLDAHQHFWEFTANPDDFEWMSDDYNVLRRNFLPSDLEPLLGASGLDGCIAVQAREIVKETDFLMNLADQHAYVQGVVGWVDLCADNVEAVLDAYSEKPTLKGFRMLIHDRADPDFAISSTHARGVGFLEQHGWTYDLLLRTIHLPAALQLVDTYPNQAFVIDHIAKPHLDGSDWAAWLSGMQEMSNRSNVFCKLSGLVTEADWKHWQAADYPRFLDKVFEAFGANRCMFGSDWPVSTCATDYHSSKAVVDQWANALSADEKQAIYGGTCAHFYGIDA